jgi:ribonucleoside-diphosphate reductase beta chain
MSTLDDVQQQTRVYSDWNSTKGLRTDILPWRLWDKAKRLHWDPADIDFTQDKKDWDSLELEQQLVVSGLATGFMVGEEGVTLDIMPLVFAMADENRAEETMFLTSFAYEEAKHVDFFHRWFNAVGCDPLEMQKIQRKRAIDAGMQVQDEERRGGLFEAILPRVMRRLLTDRSPEAFLEASVTYNQFIEGCLAIAGYRMWMQMFDAFGVLPGLKRGIGFIQDDERRHIAYGTYLCRRIIAADHSLAEFGVSKMYELRNLYVQGFPGLRSALEEAAGNGGNGNLTSAEIIEFARKRQAEVAANGGGNGGGGGYGQGNQFGIFGEVMLKQVDRRVALLRNATKIDANTAEVGAGAEEIEEALEHDAPVGAAT